jgi:hypothetical protein
MKPRRPFVSWTCLETGEPVFPAVSLRLFAFRNHRMNFVEVYLWDFAYQMRALRSGSERAARRTMAFFHEFHEQRKDTRDRRGRAIGSKKLGEIHFCRKFLTVDTIAHEIHHAVLAWGRRLKRPLPTTTEAAEHDTSTRGRWSAEELSATLQGQWTGECVEALSDHLHGPK